MRSSENAAYRTATTSAADPVLAKTSQRRATSKTASPDCEITCATHSEPDERLRRSRA